MPHPKFESVWRRGWWDAKHGWHSTPFIIWEAALSPLTGLMVGLTADPAIGGIVGVAMVISGFMGVWIGTTASAPLRQRNDARTALQPAPDSSDQERRTLARLQLRLQSLNDLYNEGQTHVIPTDEMKERFKKTQSEVGAILHELERVDLVVQFITDDPDNPGVGDLILAQGQYAFVEEVQERRYCLSQIIRQLRAGG